MGIGLLDFTGVRLSVLVWCKRDVVKRSVRELWRKLRADLGVSCLEQPNVWRQNAAIPNIGCLCHMRGGNLLQIDQQGAGLVRKVLAFKMKWVWRETRCRRSENARIRCSITCIGIVANPN